jgi:predicted transcriptional regulator
MRKAWNHRDHILESTIQDILKSQAQSRIYLFLLRKHKSKTEDIIKGTHLHPSTVRESLSKMYEQKLVFREKIKNNTIGKNPYLYFPLPPLKLLKRYAKQIEDRLNHIALLGAEISTGQDSYQPVTINIDEAGDAS